jgi:DNA-binding NarL/FixJ family response regulator
MKVQTDISRLDTPINPDGSVKTSKDFQLEAIRKTKGEVKEIISPHPESDVFDSYLKNYQDDINRIVGKFRYPSHLLSHDELVSEANLSLIKKRDEILSNYKGDFTEVNFKKLAYAFVKNVIKWTNYRIARSPYVGRRVDLQHNTEDGFKSTYELAVETNGEEDSFFDDYDRNEKYSYLMKVVREYSSLFSDKEIKVLSLLEMGLTQYEIADKLKVTHQAISLMSIKIFDKIKARFNSKVIEDDSFGKVLEGHKAISNFFNPESKNTPLEDFDRENLKSFLLSNAKRYTSKQISEIFMNGKYSHRQVAAFSVKNKLTFCLVKGKYHYKFSKSEEAEIIKLSKEGASSKDISLKMNIPKASVIGKKAHLTRTGTLTPT